MNIPRTLLILFFASLLFISSCAEEDKTEQIPELYFNIDTTLVSEYNYLDSLRLALRIPEDWNETEDIILDTVLTALENTDKTSLSFDYNPELILKDDSTQSILTIGTVKNSLGKEEYIESIESTFDKWKVKKGNFTNNNIEFTQFLIQKDNLVLFKLIFKHFDKIIQIDYALSKRHYAGEIRKVESSIGSIKPTIN